jgi:hypothetical protein
MSNEVMYKYKVILFLLMTTMTVTAAYSQTNSGNHQTATVSGTVTKIDFVGNTISILTDDNHPMSFSVPGKAIILQDTQDIGLMDVKISHPVTIKYDVSSSGKQIVDSIIDNKPAAHE